MAQLSLWRKSTNEGLNSWMSLAKNNTLIKWYAHYSIPSELMGTFVWTSTHLPWVTLNNSLSVGLLWILPVSTTWLYCKVLSNAKTINSQKPFKSLIKQDNLEASLETQTCLRHWQRLQNIIGHRSWGRRIFICWMKGWVTSIMDCRRSKTSTIITWAHWFCTFLKTTNQLWFSLNKPLRGQMCTS